MMRTIFFSLVSLAVAAFADPAVPPLRVIPKTVFTLADFEAQTPRSEAGNFLIEIPGLVNFGLTEDARAVVAGKPVETIGQVVPESLNNSGRRRLRIVRSLMNCCTVHARQFSVVIEFVEKAPDFKEMSWVKVVGTICYRVEEGNTTPVVGVKEIKEIPQPVTPVLK